MLMLILLWVTGEEGGERRRRRVGGVENREEGAETKGRGKR